MQQANSRARGLDKCRSIAPRAAAADSLKCLAGGHGPAHLHRRIDALLEGLAGNLSAISEAEFEGHREALLAAKLQKDHALGDEADRNWEQISSRR